MRNSYELLEEKNVKLLPILQFSLIDALKSVHRRISQRKGLRRGGKIFVRSKIHVSVFLEFYRAIKNWTSEYGRTLSKEKNKRGIVKEYSISFHHKGTLKYHFKQIIKGDIKNYLTKSFTAGSRGVVQIESSTPFVIRFNPNRNEMTMSCNFITINRYGNICC